ncbi:MAG: N-acetyltransferase family protein [Gemmatimonadota bacterium]
MCEAVPGPFIRSLEPSDWEAVARIYGEGIAGGNATFEARVPTWPEWDGKHVKTPRLVAVSSSGDVNGWAALSPVSARPVYAGVAEVSVYVANGSQGRGVGRALLDALVTGSEGAGFWTLQAGIFPENVSSLRLHERCGFRVLGVRERVGRQGGVWRDVLLLERRSATVGI